MPCSGACICLRGIILCIAQRALVWGRQGAHQPAAGQLGFSAAASLASYDVPRVQVLRPEVGQ